MATVYKITNVVNGKSYIGFTSYPIAFRMKTHANAARKYRNPTSYLHNAMRKYGSDKFTIEALYTSDDSVHCQKVMEPHFISEHKTHHSEGGYNLSWGGEGYQGEWTSEMKRSCMKMKKTLLERFDVEHASQARLTSKQRSLIKDVRAIHQKYHIDQGLSYRDISKKLGFCESYFGRVFWKAGLQP